MSKIKIVISLVLIILFAACNSTKKFDKQTNHLDRATYKLKFSTKDKDVYLTFFEDNTYTVRNLKKIALIGKWRQIDSGRVVFYEIDGKPKKKFDTVPFTEEYAIYRRRVFKRYDSVPLREKIYK